MKMRLIARMQEIWFQIVAKDKKWKGTLQQKKPYNKRNHQQGKASDAKGKVVKASITVAMSIVKIAISLQSAPIRK
jgi:hypothetical protein